VIGALGAEDLDEAAALYVRVFNAPPWRDAWTEESARARLADMWATPGVVGVVSRDENRLVGFALGHVERWYSGPHFYLREMCVEADRQRSGHGSRMLSALDDRLEQVTALHLLTGRGTPAEEFYRRRGFAPVDRMVFMGRARMPHLAEIR
jgi:aminoglycoside 6'-N-acetyltransferase I